MDGNCSCDIIMNNDSEFNNINDSSSEEYDDVSILDSSSDNKADAVQVPTPSTVKQLDSSQLRVISRNEVWQTGSRQPKIAMFSGMQRPTNKVS